jgi:hypothetical protein
MYNTGNQSVQQLFYASAWKHALHLADAISPAGTRGCRAGVHGRFSTASSQAVS